MGSFHEPPRPAASATIDAPVTREGPGTIIGPYKLLQPIGESGMGRSTWPNRPSPSVRRTVALKVIKAGMDSRHVLAWCGATLT